MNRRFAVSLAIVLVALASVALLISRFLDSNDSSDKLTYVNEEHGYQVDYPRNWMLVAHPTSGDCAEFCTQSIELRHPEEGEVYVVVNFQGGLCEPKPAAEGLDIEVYGRAGKEYICPGFTIKSFGDGASVARLFRNANGRQNFLVFGQAHGDVTRVTSIVRSFRFSDR